ncbi:DUF5689 domain-containing protein [Rubrivirga marina]|uniref:CBM-cenC domain-containing protein n=1 Tax=Rubrivirga marina TaxID=1196024 RepID=A0A271IWT0_9BACT|nr:DUF5689 domain-containing protein [Rubrivirga marina]PAP75274.1 hypothetical protein BSZ37_01855 [Rubrivirga marina]
MRLRFSLFFTLAALIAAPSALAQSAFLNEFHYDNDGGDTGEFVEIAVADGILDVEDVVITLYNGSGGASYNTVSGADLTVGASQNGYTLYTYSFPSNGIQNGSPDGIALSTTEGDVLQFLSYEGSFTATNGPANGETSDDIGVSEAGDTPVGFSLQLTGTSATYDGFTWASPMAATLGAVNTGQTFESPAPPDPDPVEVSFADETRMVREGDTLTVALELDYNENEPSGPVTVLVSFVGGASSATTADFASASVASATFPGQRARDNMAEVTFVFADDDLVEGPETATFRLAVTSGDAVTGSPNILTVTVDDAPQTATVADARAAGVGESVTIEGVVSRAAGAFLYVQDETGGLAIRQTSGPLFDAVASGAVAPGTQIRLTGTLSEFRGLLQINGSDLESYDVLGTTDAPEPQVVTLAELAENGEAYEGELVTVRNVSFAETGTFSAATTYTVSDDSDDSGVVTARVPNGSDSTVDGTEIPEVADVTAIIGQFNADDPDGGYQLLLINAEDVGNASGGGGGDEIVPIAEARAEGVGATVRIEGVVTRAAGAFLYLQDETGALTIRQTSGDLFDAIASGDVGPGTVLDVTGTLSEFRGLLQINGGDLESYEVTGTAAVPQPQVVTLAELAANGEDYEGELVYVAGVTVDGSGAFTAATTYLIDDNSEASGLVTLRVPNADDTTVDDTPIPDGPVGIIGVIGQFNADDPEGGFQLLVLDAADIDAPAPSLDVVVNGGFEMPAPGVVTGGDVPGFALNVGGAVTMAPEFAIVDDVAYEGDQSLAVTVNGTGANPWEIEVAAEPLTVEAGRTYLYSVWARSETDGGTASFTIGQPAPSYNELGRISDAALTTEWQEFTVEFTVPDGVTEIRAPIHFSYAANVGNTIYIDNLSITPAGEVAAENPVEETAATLSVTNPIRTGATVRYSLETAGDVSVALFDMLGRQVAVVADGPAGPQERTARLDAAGLASGVYVLRLQGEDVMVSRTVTVVR